MGSKTKLDRKLSANKTTINNDRNVNHANNATDQSLLMSYLKIMGIVAIYWAVSITMVFLNKLILSGSKYSINAPLFITWFQCLISLSIVTSGSLIANSRRNRKIYRAMLATFCRVKTISNSRLYNRSHNKQNNSMGNFPKLHIRYSIIRQVFPLTVMFVAMISFNNLCLKNVGVSFYFVGRSLTTVFNVIMTYLILSKKTSFKAIMCCLAIVAGFFLGVDQEQLLGSLSTWGVMYGVLASFFVSLNSIFTVNALSSVQDSIWLLTFYNNLIASVLFVPLMLLTGEFSTLFASTHLITNLMFWCLMLVSGVFGFLIGYVTNLQIKYTSPLTHNISGTAKACAQTVLATYLYHEVKTFNWWLSNIIVLVASAFYTRVRQLEMKHSHQAQPTDGGTSSSVPAEQTVVANKVDICSSSGEEGDDVGNGRNDDKVLLIPKHSQSV